MDTEKIVNSKLYTISDWIYKLIMLNVLWLGFTLSGLVIFSIVPATVTVYLILNDSLKGKDIPIFRTFTMIFFSKKVYFKSQKLLIILLFFFGMIGLDYWIIANYEPFANIKSGGLIVISIINYIGIMTTLHTFPIFIYFPYLSIRKTIKYAFLFSFSFPVQTIIMLFISIASLILGYIFLLYLFFVGITITIVLHLIIIRHKYMALKNEGEPLVIEDFMKL